LPPGHELRGIWWLLRDGENSFAKPEKPQNNNSSGNDVKRLSKRLTNILALAIAIPYFLLDAIFAAVAIPLAKWIAGHWAFARIHGWVLSLKPYPTLLLFIVPLIVLEPVKPVAAFLVASHHAALGLSALVIAEILKLVFIERLFSVGRTKLLSIPAFAWAYGKYSCTKNWLLSLEAAQLALRWSRIARCAAKRMMLQARRSIAREERDEQDRWIPVRAAARQARE
jgi:hypothetical protein